MNVEGFSLTIVLPEAVTLGELEAKTGQTENAVKTYRRALELDPDNAVAACYLKEHAVVCLRLDQFAQ
ncbi:tetratricopeptide repeat protein [Massilia sp. TW-1]|uniref:Tetratricopeptide repeat protein n=1 Tax=Telluria antibiotica TaxID=2717319 RepID=A0ABX0P8M2_9BURK|nr:tetratricopeptide repeat protein [Telluria antibiotica]NIA53024.1 tetratricopeptide repeat protein [Telluria antibiotica]